MLDIRELYNVIEQFTQVGFMEGIKAMQPTSDQLRATEVADWLALTYAGDAKTFKMLEREGLIKTYTIGKAVNSPKFYSKAEIKRAFATKGICDIVTKYETQKH